MTDPLPTYDAPPVIETVVGIQFERLQLPDTLVGWYWKSYLDDGWPATSVVARLEDQFERFDRRRPVVPELRISQVVEPNRIQILREDGQRMLQVQDSRFVYNWKKLDGKRYPTYRIVYSEFAEYLDGFRRFMDEAKLGELSPNQWEVVYVNIIPKGELWETPKDWPNVLPRFTALMDQLELDGFRGSWSHVIGDKKGRLHVEIRHVLNQAGQEAIQLQLTARGPIDDETSIEAGCDLGHETIVRAFTSMTSDAAHKHWKRTQ